MNDYNRISTGTRIGRILLGLLVLWACGLGFYGLLLWTESLILGGDDYLLPCLVAVIVSFLFLAASAKIIAEITWENFTRLVRDRRTGHAR